MRNKISKREPVNTTQEEAHNFFENPEFDPSLAYSSYTVAFMTVFFFQPILPISAFTGLISLVFNYYSFKKKLLRDSKRPVMVSKEITQVTLYLLNLVPLVWGVKYCDG